MNLLTDQVTIAGREVPVIAVGGGVAVAGAMFVLLSRRGRNTATPSRASLPETTQSQTTETVTPDRLSAELLTLSSGLTSQFQTLIGQNQAEQAAQLAGLQSTLTGQVSGLQSQLTGSIGDVQSQVTAEDEKITALTQRVTSLDQKVATNEANVTKVAKIQRNQIRWISSWLISQLGVFGYNQQSQQAAGLAWTGNVSVPAQAATLPYEGI